jgi:uncharacterized protein involved in exopolysaccharide biosynthesis
MIAARSLMNEPDGRARRQTAERARREVVEKGDKTLRDQIAEEAQSQQELRRERDHALQEVVDLKSRLAAMTAYVIWFGRVVLLVMRLFNLV